MLYLRVAAHSMSHRADHVCRLQAKTTALINLPVENWLGTTQKFAVRCGRSDRPQAFRTLVWEEGKYTLAAGRVCR